MSSDRAINLVIEAIKVLLIKEDFKEKLYLTEALDVIENKAVYQAPELVNTHSGFWQELCVLLGKYNCFFTESLQTKIKDLLCQKLDYKQILLEYYTIKNVNISNTFDNERYIVNMPKNAFALELDKFPVCVLQTVLL